jgi:membrane protease YdiL (CAAX protease family)
VVAIALSYFVLTSATILFVRMTRYEMTTARVLRGALIEALLLSIVLTILRARGWNLDRLGLRFSFPAALGGIPLFIAYLVLYWGTGLLLVWLFPTVARTKPFHFVITAHPLALLTFIVTNSFFEEVIVTGYVMTALSKQGAAMSITASTLLRFLYHLYQGPLASITILPLGLLFGVVYWRWRNLWPLIVAHTITNVIGMIVSGGS